MVWLSRLRGFNAIYMIFLIDVFMRALAAAGIDQGQSR
jgi:hypothetical protein